jgi:hypothetical protein
MNVENYIGKPHVVKTVDPYGFLGRELHPTKVDIGKIGVPVEVIEHAVYDNDHDMDYICFRLMMNDGRFLDFMHFEIKHLESYSV